MKRLIYTLCLIIGCATLSEAKVLTGHKTRLTDNWLYLRGHRQYLGSSASRRSRPLGMRSPMDACHPAPLLQCHRCRRPGHELLPGPRVV